MNGFVVHIQKKLKSDLAKLKQKLKQRINSKIDEESQFGRPLWGIGMQVILPFFLVLKRLGIIVLNTKL